MGDVVSPPPPPLSQYRPLLRLRNSISIAVVPHQNSSSSAATTTTSSTASSTSSYPSDDLELMSIKPVSQSYTSLRDLLPSVAVNSPKSNAAHQAQPGSGICIRNRLVKQAAWAYLQPMSTSPGSSGNNFFHRIWPRVAALIDYISSNVARAFNWMLRLIRIQSRE